MIGSFWNLCRACPSMPIDKQLHSEYRSTYTWHEYTGPHQEHTVVRRAPQPPPTSTKQASAKLQSAKSTEDENNEGPTLEPPLPRRKKCPELAYKTHEFITAADGGGIDAVDSNVVADKVREVTTQSGLPPSQLSKAISRISTEYRLQFAWPRRPQLTNGETVAPGVTAAGVPAGPAPVHKKRPGDVDHKRDGKWNTSTNFLSSNQTWVRYLRRPEPFQVAKRMQASELEPLVGGTGTDTIDGVVPEGDEREEDMSDLKIAFRSVTKEEKEKENTRKVAPVTATMTMPPAGRPSSVQARPIHGILQDDSKADTERAIARARKDFLIRHHLDRTTGVGDGALLPSPTREKLEPVIPRRREETKEHREEIQPKTKSSPKNSPRTGRSQSLGPTVTERRSPKRQPPRAPSVTKDAKEKEKEPKDKEKEQRDKGGEPERHPRPMTAEPQVNGDVTGGESSVASTPPSQTQSQPPVSATAASPWIDDEPVVKSPPEPTRVKSPEQMIMRSPEPVNWTVPLDTGKTFTVTQNVREEPLTRPHSEAKSWAPSSVPSAPQSAPPELAAQHKSQHSQHSGYKSPESESVSIGSFSGLNGHKDMDSERNSPLPSNVQASGTTAQGENESGGTEDESKEQQRSESSIKPVPGTSLRCLEDPGFEYDRKKEGNGQPTTTSTMTTPSSSTVSTGPQQGYRILEAESPQGATTTDSGGGGGGGGGGGSSVGGTGSGGGYGTPVFGSTNVPGSAQRSAASEVLEKARNRFDKFWGKGSGSEN
ncbi:hypothetical protein QLX08_008384 [Tetragonisca angustula]|uniref:Nuclear protein MDM1 n=1 Tax=Tetragonisca angustula TaxID=166442 RepID=A0AAW0ZM34_9HYME